MDKKEFAAFAMALKTYYPKEELLPNEQAVDLWFLQLQDLDFKLAETALCKWVAVNKWSPSIADIRAEAAAIRFGDLPDWGEGWEQVIKAIAKYGMYRPQEALESMDKITKLFENKKQRGVGIKISPNLIKDSELPPDYNKGVLPISPCPTAAIMLSSISVPTVYDEDSDVLAVFSENARHLSENELHRNMIIDA